ncbi:MAG: hypothetical protein AAF517_07525 [Planctomycetota bacterium]
MRSLACLSLLVPFLVSFAPPPYVSNLRGKAYARRIEDLKSRKKLTKIESKNPDSSITRLWIENRVVVCIEEEEPLKKYSPKLPEFRSFNEISWIESGQVHFTVLNPGELRLFYEAIQRSSFVESKAKPRWTYYLPDGTLAYKAVDPVDPPEVVHFCVSGLFFRSAGKTVYMLDAHEGQITFDLGRSGEPDIVNYALRDLVLRYMKLAGRR